MHTRTHTRQLSPCSVIINEVHLRGHLFPTLTVKRPFKNTLLTTAAATNTRSICQSSPRRPERLEPCYTFHCLPSVLALLAQELSVATKFIFSVTCFFFFFKGQLQSQLQVEEVKSSLRTHVHI